MTPPADSAPRFSRRLFRAARWALALMTIHWVGYSVSMGLYLLIFNPGVIAQTLLSSQSAVLAASRQASVNAAGAPWVQQSPLMAALASAGAAYSIGRLYPVVGEPVALFLGAASGFRQGQSSTPAASPSN
ncbi:MAG: hypothetical protein IPK79_02330 [Vampirovibrionales bacterium]|nr:hypothetical protein [Vampirovibrionales bacterium]